MILDFQLNPEALSRFFCRRCCDSPEGALPGQEEEQTRKVRWRWEGSGSGSKKHSNGLEQLLMMDHSRNMAIVARW